MGGHVVVMAEGRALQAGPMLEVYHRPGSARVATTFVSFSISRNSILR